MRIGRRRVYGDFCHSYPAAQVAASRALGFSSTPRNQQRAAEVYAASLLAIEVDTDAERQYLQQLAQATGLNPTVVQYINQTMGL